MPAASPASAYPTLALGVGLVAIAASPLLPDAWVFAGRLVIPALVMAGLWLFASRRVPAGWERNSYAVAAVLTALTSTILVWVTLSFGPLTVLAAAVVAVALAGRHLVPLVAAGAVLAASGGSLWDEGTPMALTVAGALFVIVGARSLRSIEPARPTTPSTTEDLVL